MIGGEGNPHYNCVNKDSINLIFTSGILFEFNKEGLKGIITHYAPDYFVQKFSKEIKKDFPIIQYRRSQEEIKKVKGIFKIKNLPSKNLSSIKTPKELGNLVDRFFPWGLPRSLLR